MGFFSKKKKIFVSSVVYNLAGDVNKRPNFMKTILIGAIMGNSESIPETIVNSYLGGPGLRTRNFGKWARTSGYSAAVGQAGTKFNAGMVVPATTVASQIPAAPGTTVFVQAAQAGPAEYTYWVDQAILLYSPEAIFRPYEADYNVATGQIDVYFTDNGETISITPVGYNVNGEYIYATYVNATGSSEGTVVPGSWIDVPEGDSLPSTAGWETVTDATTPINWDLAREVTTEITYSDLRPPEGGTTTTHTFHPYNDGDIDYKKSSYVGTNPAGEFLVETQFMTQRVHGSETITTTVVTTNETITGGVIKTTKTTTKQDVFVLVQSYKIDERDDVLSGQSNNFVYIYQKGTGNVVLDALFKPLIFTGSFLPHIPFRIDNKMVDETNFPDLYPLVKKAFKKGTTGNFDKISDKIANNGSIGDIDYVYAAFGVSLNVKENACRKYLWKFFRRVQSNASLSGYAEYLLWKSAWDAADAKQNTWVAWRAAQDFGSGPLFGTPEPEQATYPSMPINSIRVNSAGNPAMNFDTMISWNYIREVVGSGLFNPTAKVGDVFISSFNKETLIGKTYFVGDDPGVIPMDELGVDTMYIVLQESETIWRRLNINGLNYKSFIYKGKFVEIGASDAIEDTDESGFIIPLHEDVYHEMGMKDGTQMSTASCFLIFNCYEVVKQKWYQTGLFKVIIVIVVIIIAVFSGGSGAGLLGPALQVGAALGFVGVVAIIVGAAINAIAGMILMTIIQVGANKLFGEKIGAIVGAIAAIVAVSVGSSMNSGGLSFSAAIGELANVENILKLTAAAGKGYAGYLTAAANELMAETAEYQDYFKQESNSISEQYAKLFGTDNVSLDPSRLTDAVGIFDSTMEPVNSFLGRTLMTGSEVAQLSMDMVKEFTRITLSTELP